MLIIDYSAEMTLAQLCVFQATHLLSHNSLILKPFMPAAGALQQYDSTLLEIHVALSVPAHLVVFNSERIPAKHVCSHSIA